MMGLKSVRAARAPIAVDTLGLLRSVVITSANEQERAQIGELCRQEIMRQATQVCFGQTSFNKRYKLN
jgi:hypothetical protein